MKIGIVTQPLLNNYGGILQNFALQYVLRALEHEPITLDYQYSAYLQYRNYIKKIGLYGYGKIIGRKSSKPEVPVIRRNSEFDRFVNSQINLTTPIHKYNASIINRYNLDGIIVGSDQVWRPRYNNHLFAMFLNFAKDYDIKRIAYAASFGVDEWEYNVTQTQLCCELVHEFDAISVREESGAMLVRKYFKMDATVILDPTMLLESSVYEHLCESVPHSGRYIAVYTLDISPQYTDLINMIAKTEQLEVRYFSADARCTLSIEEWLATIRHAQYVITDSFHGTVFSIIFNRPFLTFDNSKRGNCRLHDLLHAFNIENRMCSDISQLTYKRLNTAIDWEYVNRQKSQRIQDAKSFLMHVLI